ncbi:hypothetical protein ACTNED_09000 [Absicoccus porci]|uniref:hypothetical protein n=1 Tax=Absicoccus porci TaxID=2486576 RepID=UPI003F8B58C0
MSESIKLIYKILKILEQSMDYVFRGAYFRPPENPRQGVHIKDAKETLLKGAVGKTMTNTRGQKSIVYIGDKCSVTINPDTGMLIQINPSRKRGD